MYEAPYVFCVAVEPLLSEPLCVVDFQGGVQKAKCKLRQLKLYVQLATAEQCLIYKWHRVNLMV